MALSGSCHQLSTDSAVPPKSVSGRCRVSNRRATGLWDRPSKPSDRYSRSCRDKDQMLKGHVVPGSTLLATAAALSSGLGQLIYWHTDLSCPRAASNYKAKCLVIGLRLILSVYFENPNTVITCDTPLGCFAGMS